MPVVKLSKVTHNRYLRLCAVQKDVEKAHAQADQAVASWANSKAVDFEKAGFRIGQLVQVPHPGPGLLAGAQVVANITRFLVVGVTVGGKTTREPRLAVWSRTGRFLADPAKAEILPKKHQIKSENFQTSLELTSMERALGMLNYSNKGPLLEVRPLTMAEAEDMVRKFQGTKAGEVFRRLRASLEITKRQQQTVNFMKTHGIRIDMTGLGKTKRKRRKRA